MRYSEEMYFFPHSSMSLIKKRLLSLVLAGAVGVVTFLPAESASAAGILPLSTAVQQARAQQQPSIRSIQRLIERTVGIPIVWDGVEGALEDGALTMSGHDVRASGIVIECEITFPPLRIRCTIIVEIGGGGGE
jgi:hypothetical protein